MEMAPVSSAVQIPVHLVEKSGPNGTCLESEKLVKYRLLISLKSLTSTKKYWHCKGAQSESIDVSFISGKGVHARELDTICQVVSPTWPPTATANTSLDLRRHQRKKHYKVQCGHCIKSGETTQAFTARSENYESHLRKCRFYQATLPQTATPTPPTTPRQCTREAIVMFESLLVAFEHRLRLSENVIKQQLLGSQLLLFGCVMHGLHT